MAKLVVLETAAHIRNVLGSSPSRSTNENNDLKYLPIFICMRPYNTKKSNSWEKSGIYPKDISKEEFIKACRDSESMAHAASKLGVHFATVKKYALEYGCYNPNQQGKGIKKQFNNKTSLDNIISRSGVKRRILKENLIEYKCHVCDIKEWQGKKLSLHLDHINGNCWDHKLDNLRFLCPNCHSLTETYNGRNKKPIVKSSKKIKLNDKFRKQNKEKIEIIRKSNIDFTQYGWRIKLSKILNFTPQYVGNFIKLNLPDIWETAWKHNNK